MERTFLMLKPETIKGKLIGRVIERVEKAGFTILALKFIKATHEQAARLYEVHRGKSFYPELVAHITSGAILPMVVEAPQAVERARQLIGATDPLKAEKGTIRGDFGLSITQNIIHAADSAENAIREMKVFFHEDEIPDASKTLTD